MQNQTWQGAERVWQKCHNDPTQANGDTGERQEIDDNQKLLEIEKEIVHEVPRGDKPYMRKSTDRKAQIRKAFVQLSGLICALRSVTDFLM